jgi:hypothetical protein
MKALLAVLIFALPISAHAGEHSLSLSFGPTINGTIGAKKALALGYEHNWSGPSVLLTAGTWNADGGMAFYGSVNLGVHVAAPSGLMARIGFGPAAISQTDDRLSSIGEFHIQARAGLELARWSVGLQFDHFSNAGIVPPNLGRDIVALYIGIPLPGGD